MKQINLFFLIFILSLSPVQGSDLEFNQWKEKFKKKVLDNNISEKTYNKTIANVKFLPQVIKYDRYQPEFYEDTKTYITKRTSKNKVKKGINFYSKNKNLINDVESGPANHPDIKKIFSHFDGNSYIPHNLATN